MTDLDAPRPARRSWWLEEALALPEFAGPDTPPLRGDTDADVLILGGGYTGMWTAWFLTQREPALDVVLLERDICGGGPSGRNGGFVNGLYDEAGPLLERHGEGGRRTIEAAARSIDEVGTWCKDTGVDAWYEPSGDLGVSTNPAHDASLRETVSESPRRSASDTVSRTEASCAAFVDTPRSPDGSYQASTPASSHHVPTSSIDRAAASIVRRPPSP